MKQELLYHAALEYQKKLREVENYRAAMSLPKNRYDGWWADLASDILCVRRLAREKYKARLAIIKGVDKDGQN